MSRPRPPGGAPGAGLARGSRAEVIELATTARTAEDAARSLGVPVGAIVKSLLFTIDGAR